VPTRSRRTISLAVRIGGIENVSDLRGKKIGIPLGTSVEFYLGRFLILHGIYSRDVTVVDIRPSQFVNATVNGDVDVIICWQPYVNKIKDMLGSGIVIWPAQNSQLTYGVIVCRNDWAAGLPELISGLLKSLDLAVGTQSAILRKQRRSYKKGLTSAMHI